MRQASAAALALALVGCATANSEPSARESRADPNPRVGAVRVVATAQPAATAGPTATATAEPSATATAEPSATATTEPVRVDAPPATLLPTTHVWQKWNNCGPSAALMALGVFGPAPEQSDVAARLKPDREDTNVTPDEIVRLVRSEGLGALERYGGTAELARSLVGIGSPVIAEQWIDVEGRGEMGHYRVVVGYDEPAGELIVQDSYYGPNRRMSYGEFEAMWRPFLGAYVVVYRPEDEAAVRAVLGPDADETAMWSRLAEDIGAWAAAEPGSAWAHFALGEALERTERHGEAVAAFDRAIAIGLPYRAFWYQFGLYRSLFALGAYDRMIAHANATLETMGGENLEESRYWRGMALRALGREDEARAEFETALRYNPLYAPAAEALADPP